MHEQGIMHRDVKPENIMFAQNVETSRDNPKTAQTFNVKVIDLGMAARLDPKTPLRGETHCSVFFHEVMPSSRGHSSLSKHITVNASKRAATLPCASHTMQSLSLETARQL